MSTILDTIIASKRSDLLHRKKEKPLSEWENHPAFGRPSGRSLRSRLLSKENTGIIAEFKRKSPSKGWLADPALGVEEVVTAYAAAGAAAVSVLTDESFFGGSLADLVRARACTDIPLLRKDFMIDEWQIAEARVSGADVILLIAACLSPAEVKRLAAYAKAAGLEVLLELHGEEELNHICDETEIIGINNRNLRTFEVDIDRSLKMAENIPEGKIRVAESGIATMDDIRLFRDHGFQGFLVGERFMKFPDPGKAFAEFARQVSAI